MKQIDRCQAGGRKEGRKGLTKELISMYAQTTDTHNTQGNKWRGVESGGRGGKEE